MDENTLRARIVTGIFGVVDPTDLANLADEVCNSPWFESNLNIEIIKLTPPNVQPIDPPSGSRFSAGSEVSFTFRTNRSDLNHTAKIFHITDPNTQIGQDGTVTVASTGDGVCTFANSGTDPDEEYYVEFHFDGMFPQDVYRFHTRREKFLQVIGRVVGAVLRPIAAVFRAIFRPFQNPPRRIPPPPPRARLPRPR